MEGKCYRVSSGEKTSREQTSSSSNSLTSCCPVLHVQLKKLIKDVVTELSGMGLNPDVLHRILKSEEDNTTGVGSSSSSHPPPQTGRTISPEHTPSQAGTELEEMEFVFEEDEPDSQPHFGPSGEENEVPDSTSIRNPQPRTFRVRLPSQEGNTRPTSLRPSSFLGGDERREPIRTRSLSPTGMDMPSRVDSPNTHGPARIKAEYVFSGESEMYVIPYTRV